MSPLADTAGVAVHSGQGRPAILGSRSMAMVPGSISLKMLALQSKKSAYFYVGLPAAPGSRSMAMVPGSIHVKRLALQSRKIGLLLCWQYGIRYHDRYCCGRSISTTAPNMLLIFFLATPCFALRALVSIPRLPGKIAQVSAMITGAFSYGGRQYVSSCISQK